MVCYFPRMTCLVLLQANTLGGKINSSSFNNNRRQTDPPLGIKQDMCPLLTTKGLFGLSVSIKHSGLLLLIHSLRSLFVLVDRIATVPAAYEPR